MKKLICICLVLLLFSGCSSDILCENENYRIFRKDGKMYMEFLKDFSGTEGKLYPRFNTLEEMVPIILSGGLSEENLNSLQRRSTDNLPEIWNLDNIYDLRMPDSVQIVAVFWLGDYYEVYIQDREQGGNGCFQILDKKKYEGKFDKEYKVKSYEDRTVDYEEYVEDRNAHIIHYLVDRVRLATSKEIRYRLDIPTGYIYALEDYSVGSPSYYHAPYFTDDQPSQIVLFGCDKGIYFYVHFDPLIERPPVEWITAFGVK